MELDEHSAVTDTLKEVAMELDEHSAVTDTLKEAAMELVEHSAVTDTLKEAAMELDEHSAVTDTLKELAMELVEHSAVTDTLKEADETRKCCLMLGGVLGERTVQEALPALGNYKEQIQKITDADTTASGKGKRTK
ncbi:hypothetical protein E5288_WYG008243 [Bos mutus]|uniref:Uncharacterized protein n=1 Tax=Bos mutus TaxID=72004 RepID=A0A6B0RXJ8_9CETA|nr:hypothetical protein [Bos mutus]